MATKCLPDDRWIMLPRDRSKWGQTLHGTTAESLALSRGANPAITREDAPGLIITRGAQDDAVQIWTKGADAAGLPRRSTQVVAEVDIAAMPCGGRLTPANN